MKSKAKTARRNPGRLERLVGCLAHVIYWPLRMMYPLGCWLIFFGIGAACVELAWDGCSWLWHNLKMGCVIAIFSITGGLLMVAFDWAKRKLGKDI
jgi:hypothetical protein